MLFLHSWNRESALNQLSGCDNYFLKLGPRSSAGKYLGVLITVL
jgi:hypothetical protein